MVGRTVSQEGRPWEGRRGTKKVVFNILLYGTIFKTLHGPKSQVAQEEVQLTLRTGLPCAGHLHMTSSVNAVHAGLFLVIFSVTRSCL